MILKEQMAVKKKCLDKFKYWKWLDKDYKHFANSCISEHSQHSNWTSLIILIYKINFNNNIQIYIFMCLKQEGPEKDDFERKMVLKKKCLDKWSVYLFAIGILNPTLQKYNVENHCHN